MNTGAGILGGEVAAEVGEDMIVISPEEGKEIIVVEAGASVEVLIITRNVEEANMMMKGVVEVGLMEGVLLFLFRFLHVQLWLYEILFNAVWVL